ncbi:2-hydroxyisoflavanone dehydratase-like [Canna indica]|uniref:2-hydroxyisoflavanone dehydratase-like n=1 Tax=Canna indica TaxID=4628 RepID=A0AAQ3JQ70_9LILI|nr:2-hydroxyisoflavanone dehydratase-like [Canna indica]
MDASNEIAEDISPIIRTYKDGRLERLDSAERVPPSLDPVTGVASKDVVIHPDTGISARLYLPKVGASTKLAVLVYFHGGGFCIWSAFSIPYHRLLNSIVSKANVVAVSVEYRLAPEHPIPAAYDDGWRALQWVASHAEGGPEPWLARERTNFSRVFLAGDSSGANMAHDVATRVGAEGLGGCSDVRVEGVVLLHPYFWGTERLPSEQGRDDGPLIRPEAARNLWMFVSGGAGFDNPRINPLAEGAPSLASLACRRVLVAVAGKDTLRDRGRAYCESLRSSGWGGEVELLETEGRDHGFFVFRPESRDASVLFKRLACFMMSKSKL